MRKQLAFRFVCCIRSAILKFAPSKLWVAGSNPAGRVYRRPQSRNQKSAGSLIDLDNGADDGPGVRVDQKVYLPTFSVVD